MNIFAGKSPSERNKIIAAAVLGVLSLFSLYLAFGGSFFSSKPAVTVNVSTTPTPTNATNGTVAAPQAQITQEELLLDYTSNPVVYNPGIFGAPDPGRNIFAFYEPPVPTPYVPTPYVPTPMPPVKTPTPVPPPPQTIASITPQSVYAGTKTFRVNVFGEGFTPETRILFNGSEMPTTYISPQQVSAEIPANLIINEGPRQIMTATPDGKLYSNQFALNVEAPPTPKFRYIGMIARKHYNNDTAYFKEDETSKDPIGARLNDIVASRFRVVSISSKEVVLEDINLGFRHRLALYNPPPGSTQNAPTRNTYPQREVYSQPMPDPNMEQPQMQQNIPGIPGNVQPYNPTMPPNPTMPNPTMPNPTMPSNRININRQRQKPPVDPDDDGDGKPR